MPELIRDVPCILCGRMLERETICQIADYSVEEGVTIGPLYDGVICEARGNYGSTKHDPLVETSRLYFAICDDCFEKHREKMWAVAGHPQCGAEKFARLWQDPDDPKKQWTAGIRVTIRSGVLGSRHRLSIPVTSEGITIPEALRNLAEAIELQGE